MDDILEGAADKLIKWFADLVMYMHLVLALIAKCRARDEEVRSDRQLKQLMRDRSLET